MATGAELKAMTGPSGSDLKSAAEPDFGIVKFVDRVVRNIAQGATLGFADEFAAFMRSKTEDVEFEQALQQERAKDVEFEQAFPTTAMGGKIAGAIASVPAKVAMPARGAGLLAQTGRGAAVGAGVGAVTGFGEGEGGLAPRLRNAVEGGFTGAIAGGVLSPAIQVAGIGLRKLGHLFTGKLGAESQAARKVLQALQEDKIDAAEAVKRLRELGPDAGLADIGEENVRGVARAVAGTPGPARTRAKEFLTERQSGQGGRVVDQVQKSFGEFRKFAAASDDLMEARAAASAPKYAEAYRTDVPLTGELIDILQTDAAKRAFGLAKRIASNEGRKLPDVIRIADDGTLKIDIEAVPDMRSWDIMKRAMDALLNRQRNQVTGKLDLSDPLTFSINEVRSRMVAELDRLNPAYKEARAVFAGPAQALDAMQRGRAFLKGDADLTTKVIKAMTPAERDFFRMGVVRGIQDVVEGTRDVTDVTGRLFGSQTMRDKLRAVFPDQKAFDQFERFMKAEATMAETRKIVLGGSPTARIIEEQGALKTGAEMGAEAVFGSPAMLIRTAFSALRSRLDPEVSERLGKMLFQPGGKINEATVRRIFRSEPLAGVPPEATAQLRRAIQGMASTGAGVTAGQ